MNNRENWQVKNEQYLAAAIRWLRLHLSAKAQLEDVTPTDVAQAEMEMVTAEGIKPPPALITLRQQLGLSLFEAEVLLLCIGMELHHEIPRLCALIQGKQRNYPTFSLAFSVFDRPTWDIVSPDRPLRYWRLIEILQSGIEPLTTSPLRADERIVNYSKGLCYLDDRLTSIISPLELQNPLTADGKLDLPPSQQTAVETIIRKLELNTSYPLSIQLLGADPASKKRVCWQVCQRLGLKLYRLPVTLLPTQGHELETVARLWERESLLQPIALYLEVQSQDDYITYEQKVAISRFLDRSNGFFFVEVREPTLVLERETLTLDIAKPKVGEQIAAWEAVLGTNNRDTAVQIAGQFNLSMAQIGKVVKDVGEEKGDRPLAAKLWQNGLAVTRPHFHNLAQQIDIKATWDNLVLPKEEKMLLQHIANQVRQRGKVYEDWGFHQRLNRGQGISALFAGESGTGKTMAAEVIANDLGLSLYRIDLATVVSKYIGETEKNLRRLFDAAEDGGAILFFDEADALFGKRSEVKDSHDRYANIEINYLLQRLEAYRGLAILATNLKSSLDKAFLRRLRFVVNFPFPGIKERKAMWEKAFPRETPTEEIDCDRLAKFNLTGGNIHNIALNAAFIAAQAGTAVKMESVLAATRMEFRKLERPINEADFQ
ncbi:MAG: ATP-binding protein [Xenococcaceae cyanobacterium]